MEDRLFIDFKVLMDKSKRRLEYLRSGQLNLKFKKRIKIRFMCYSLPRLKDYSNKKLYLAQIKDNNKK